MLAQVAAKPGTGRVESDGFLNSRERILAGIFENVLSLDRINRNDNFFEMGGSSLLVLELLAQIKKSFGIDLPVAALFDSPTAAGLCERLGAALPVAGKPASLLAVKPGGQRQPLYFTPGGDGGEGAFLVYAGLVRYLAPDQPFYGLTARGIENSLPVHHSVEEMAHDYLAEVRSHQPDGPYTLAGECLGGVIAYEMACQLKAAGQDVASLIIFDGYPPSASAVVDTAAGRPVSP